MRSPILRVGEVSASWDLRQSKAHQRLSNTRQYKVFLYLPPFYRNSNGILSLPIRPTFGGAGPSGSKWYQLKCPPHIPIRLYTIGLLGPFDHNKQRGRQTDRQTDRAIGIGRLCCSIGGLIIIQFAGSDRWIKNI